MFFVEEVKVLRSLNLIFLNLLVDLQFATSNATDSIKEMILMIVETVLFSFEFIKDEGWLLLNIGFLRPACMKRQVANFGLFIFFLELVVDLLHDFEPPEDECLILLLEIDFLVVITECLHVLLGVVCDSR